MGLDKKVIRFGPFKDVVANAVKAGDEVYLSGQVGVDAAGRIVGQNELTAQVEQAYRNIRDILARLDADLSSVVDETWFVTDMEQVMANFRQVYAVREAAYGGPPDTAQTLVQVSALAMPGLMVEIKCIARL